MYAHYRYACAYLDTPETYLGVRVCVQWNGNKWYNGVIDNWDEKRFQHHVTYDDNDKR